jgi:hypothetical protein
VFTVEVATINVYYEERAYTESERKTLRGKSERDPEIRMGKRCTYYVKIVHSRHVRCCKRRLRSKYGRGEEKINKRRSKQRANSRRYHLLLLLLSGAHVSRIRTPREQ